MAYPDPKAKDENLVVVDRKPRRRLHRPGPLSAIKARKEFACFELVRQPGLSVVPVSQPVWDAFLAISK